MWLPSASDSDGNNVSLWVEVGIREFERKEGTASSTNQLRTLQLFVRSQYIYIIWNSSSSAGMGIIDDWQRVDLMTLVLCDVIVSLCHPPLNISDMYYHHDISE